MSTSRDVPADAHLTFWGKARPSEPPPAPQWHPVAYHLLDVAAVLRQLLLVRPLVLGRAAHLLGLSEDEALCLLPTLAALHDLGKFAPAFQSQAPEHWPPALGALDPERILPGRHTEDGYVLWIHDLAESVGERVWRGGGDVLDALAPAIFGHHGRPAGGEDLAFRQRFSPTALAASRQCAGAVVSLLCPKSLSARPPDLRRAQIASWYVAGLMTTADWVGSGAHWFRYTAPLPNDESLARYWDLAHKAAERAALEAGLVAPPVAGLRSFAVLTRIAGDPTPLQRWAETIPLPEGPCLVIIEDVTGAGKTEAAQMIVHRLLAAGRGAGAYWAMPTQATANAMYTRQASMLSSLYADGAEPKPSLVLAHGQQRLHSAFRDTVLPGAAASGGRLAEDTPASGQADDLPGTVACAAFLADDRRAALLADVGAGTVDQAILGVLPSRFNAVRLAGLADKVLVVDEAHAYDAYMGVEVEGLLRFQAALGGCAVVLSATLPMARRALLAQAWTDGLHAGGWLTGPAEPNAPPLQCDAYPLATVVSADGVREEPLAPANWSTRSLAVRRVHRVEEALQHVETWAAQGAAVAWVRNTVDDCLAAAAQLRERGADKVLVFHARFAQCDRQAREQEVLREYFGKDASDARRAGAVLVATQVVEQSLDLDFDVLVSDLAPIDLLIQRAGRLQRHKARDESRPPGLERELVVLSPPRDPNPGADWLGGIFAGTAAVYRNAGVLWRTVEALHETGAIKTPDGLRDLIEAVYGAERIEDVPTGLQPKTDKAVGEELAAAQQGVYATLNVASGYRAAGFAWLPETRVRTRLGEEPTTVRLARVRPDCTLSPWASQEMPEWRAWALSEVRTTRIPGNAVPLAEFAAAAAAARSGWGRFEQEIPILPLTEGPDTGLWHGVLVVSDAGARRTVRYSAATGLGFE